jgi:hypothetical protein
VAIKVSTVARSVGQVRKITSNTADVLTLASNWTITPSSTCTYQIGQGEARMLWDEYLALALETYFNFSGNTTPTDVNAKFKRLVDKYGKIATGGVALFEDEEYLAEVAELGKVIFTAKAEGVVS